MPRISPQRRGRAWRTKPRSKPLILVCGLPASGNRLVSRLLEAAGAETLILHGADSDRSFHIAIPRELEARLVKPRDARIVIPVRNGGPWVRSMLDNHSGIVDAHSHPDEYRGRAFATTLYWAAKLRIPLTLVSYENLTRDPEGTREQLLLDCRLRPNTPWPEKVYDADEPRMLDVDEAVRRDPAKAAMLRPALVAEVLGVSQ